MRPSDALEPNAAPASDPLPLVGRVSPSRIFTAVVLPDDGARDPGVVTDEETMHALHRHRVRHGELRRNGYGQGTRRIADRTDRRRELGRDAWLLQEVSPELVDGHAVTRHDRRL